MNSNLSNTDRFRCNAMSSDSEPKHETLPSWSHMEKELKILKAENKDLKVQLEEARSALKRLTSEQSHEKFDERRINLLKLHIIQLERQVLLMSKALGSRSATLTEVENALTWLLEKFRHYIGLEIKSPEVPVPRSDLISMVATSESARLRLFKNIEQNSSKENLSQPYMFLSNFLRPGAQKEFTVLDTCLCHTEFLNLKHVAQLESKLSLLYKELIKVSESLSSRTVTSKEALSWHVTSAAWERGQKLVLQAAATAKDCAGELLSLSLLFPAAPWPALSKPVVKDVTFESLLPSLPHLPRSKAAEVQKCVTAALTACNHRCHMLQQEVGALRDEVQFHQAVYDVQLKYIQEALAAFSDGYCTFEKSTNDLIVQPIKKMIEYYEMLKKSQGEDDLRNFLQYFKENEEQLTFIIQQLEVTETQPKSGQEILSRFGREFMTHLNKLVSDRQMERDKAADEKRELQMGQQQLEKDLHDVIKDTEHWKHLAEDVKPPGSAEQNATTPSVMMPLSSTMQTSGFQQQSEGEAHRELEAGFESSDKLKHKHPRMKGKMLPSRNCSERRKTYNDLNYNACSLQALACSPQEVNDGNAKMVSVQQTSADAKTLKTTASQSITDQSLQGRPSSNRAVYGKPPSEKGFTKPQAKKKPASYEPRLYVPNRTLQLRRSGSLTRLAEPSLEDRLKNSLSDATSISFTSIQSNGGELQNFTCETNSQLAK